MDKILRQAPSFAKALEDRQDERKGILMNRKELSRITIDISKVDHKRLKAVAAILGKSMRDIVIESIQERLHQTKIPNKKTLSAIANIEAGKDLVQAEDVQDLFKKLGI